MIMVFLFMMIISMFLVLVFTDEYWNMGMVENIFTNTTENGASESPVAPTSTDDISGIELVRSFHYDLTRVTLKTFKSVFNLKFTRNFRDVAIYTPKRKCVHIWTKHIWKNSITVLMDS